MGKRERKEYRDKITVEIDGWEDEGMEDDGESGEYRDFEIESYISEHN